MERRVAGGVYVHAQGTVHVTVKVLTPFPGPSGGNCVSARLIKSSGAGMRLRLQFPVTCGSAVEISDGDDPVLGTVCSCVSGGGAYVIGVRVTHDHVLAG